MTAKKMTPTAARKARKATVHGSRVKKVYGLTRAEYEAVLAAQHGVCAICQGKRPYRLCVDHNHSTGEVRGLLCRRCNKVLRDVRDQINVLQQSVLYLTHPPVRKLLGPRFVPLPEVTE